MAKNFAMSADEYQGHCDEYDGVCLACGEIQDGGVEPDAEGYECEACGRKRVCGVEQALLLGWVAITEDEEGTDE